MPYSPPPYDSENIFAKIIRGEIPCQKVKETHYSLAFHDIQPQASVHILVIPKGPYVDFSDFALRAPQMEKDDFFECVGRLPTSLNLEKGWRLISNAGLHGGQEVPHMHVHLLGGQALGPLISSQTEPS